MFFFCKIMASKLALFTVPFKNPFRQMTNLHYSFFHFCHRCQVTLKKDDLKKSKILKIFKAMIPVLSLATKWHDDKILSTVLLTISIYKKVKNFNSLKEISLFQKWRTLLQISWHLQLLTFNCFKNWELNKENIKKYLFR